MKRTSRPDPEAPQPLDRDRLRSALRGASREALLQALDRAIDVLPAEELVVIASGLVELEAVTRLGDVLADVRAFDAASRAGDYYQAFDVNSKNYMDLSSGTEKWLAECARLFRRCGEEAEENGPAVTREALGVLLDLVRAVDEGDDEIVFFADEGGSRLLDVEWEVVLPLWFFSLSTTTRAPEDYAREVVRTLESRFARHRRESFAKAARDAASPEQRRVLPALRR